MPHEHAHDESIGPGGGVDALSRRFGAVLVRYFTRRGVAPDDAPDLAQDVFSRLSTRDALAGVGNPEGYLFATAANIALDYHRRRKVRADYARHVVAGVADEAFAAREDRTPERTLAARQELAAVTAALNEMPERMRNIFVLARLENLPRAEIAARLGVSKRTVEGQLTLAVACLADMRRRGE